MKNAFGYQYEKPTIPVNWNPQERNFFNQLMGLFDRLFSMKLGPDRLKETYVQEKELIDKIYPVGVILRFLLVTDDPNELFPGTTWVVFSEDADTGTYEWVRIE